ncbi:MAG: hypothetical protein U5M51_07435 [Emticicia sp.]|nr:hypothetical protein [Emticicia sp.]
MSDDELDRLFSQSAEKMDFDFDPDSWTKMSQKLDAAAPPPSSSQGITPWFKRSLLLLVGLFAFMGGYFLLKPLPNQSKETLVDVVKKAENESIKTGSKKYVETSKVETDNLKVSEATTETTENTKSNKTNIVSEESEVFDKNDNNSEIKKLTETNKSLEKRKVSFLNKTLNKLSKEGKNSNLSEKNTEVHNNSEDKISVKNTKIRRANNAILSKASGEADTNNSLVETKEFSVRNLTSKSIKKINKTQPFSNSETDNDVVQNLDNQANNLTPINVTLEQNRLTLKNLDLLLPKGTFIKSSISLPIIAFENPVKETPFVPKSSQQSFKKGLYFRFGVSPDISLVTMNEMTKSGNNTAFLLEYRFNNRLSVQGGVLRSMKYYDAYPESYEWPANWGSPPKITDINATCKMLDIPLNIRYDISQKKLSRFFVSAGATSYIMLNEKHVYNYENPADPKIMWKTWEGKTAPSYLGALNFSAGYEYQLFGKLSVQAEPFFKMPISQFGLGKVNLSTFGLLVSAKYPILIRK